MGDVREIHAGETRLAAAALLELRPIGRDLDEMVRAVDEQREAGYRVAGSFETGEEEAAGVAGFRVMFSLAWARFLYVDDLVTRAAMRRRGHARALMAWIEAEAERRGCTQIHLDSGVGADRAEAHRLYLQSGLRITAHHFARRLD